MKNIFRLFLAVLVLTTLSQNAFAQNDSLVKVTTTVKPINDSTYQLQYTIQAKEGWRVYGQTISPESKTDTFTTAPHFLFSLETIKTKGATSFATAASNQKDELFENAFIFPAGAIKASDTITIYGFQPDSVKAKLLIAIAKGNEFYQQEVPVSFFLANGKKAEAFQIQLTVTATNAPAGACGEAASDGKMQMGGPYLFWDYWAA